MTSVHDDNVAQQRYIALMPKSASDRKFSIHAQELLSWYGQQKRDLPWRKNRDPYRIWISEIMLQQTTVVAVIPFYERFMQRFPLAKTLAQAPIEEVLEAWAGLGYYTRARNLHRSAQILDAQGFPKTHVELEELPGFGPYTARAVASIAFDQKVGVLDGNVIRVLSRMYALDLEWWKPAARRELQVIADHLAQVDTPADLNQALMELGATVCTPTSPACLLCPWSSSCNARLQREIEKYPRKKPRRALETWIWKPVIHERAGTVALIKNDYAPFLRNHWIWPGTVKRASKAPAQFTYRGGATHHDIFVILQKSARTQSADSKLKWIKREELAGVTPSSLVRKALEKL